MTHDTMVNAFSSYIRSPGNYALTNLFNKSWAAGRARKIFSAITRRSNRLLDLDSYSIGRDHGYYAGKREVSLDKIRGTENRLSDFDDQFHPLTDENQQRWLSVARANAQGIDLPPVELIQIGDTYFVRDGHHRISVARAFGQTSINANVTVY